MHVSRFTHTCLWISGTVCGWCLWHPRSPLTSNCANRLNGVELPLDLDTATGQRVRLLVLCVCLSFCESVCSSVYLSACVCVCVCVCACVVSVCAPLCGSCHTDALKCVMHAPAKAYSLEQQLRLGIGESGVLID